MTSPTMASSDRTQRTRTPSQSTMRAAIVQAPGQIALVRVPMPLPGRRQIRLRLEGCGVCASNIPPFEGRSWYSYPMAPGAPGHEGWGVVDAAGLDVHEFSPGDRVAALSQSAYAEYDIADVSAAVKLPPVLDHRPFPAEPLGCALNVFRRSGICAGDRVAIVGIGFLGALLTRLARNEGATVIALSSRPTSLAAARLLGAQHALRLESRDSALQAVNEITGNTLCDVVIEAVGKEEPLNLAAELTKERGRLVIAGYHQDGPRYINMQLWNWRGLDVINAHERDPAVHLRGMSAAVHAVASGRLEPWRLFTHHYPLERLGEALQATRDRPEGFMKAVIDL